MTTRWRVVYFEHTTEVLDKDNNLVCSISNDYDHAKTYAESIVRDHNDAQGLRKFVQRVADGLLTANIRKEAQAALAQAEQVDGKP